MSKRHKQFEILINNHINELYIESISGGVVERFHVLDPMAKAGDRNYFLLGKFIHGSTTYNFALNMELSQKRRIINCPSPDASGTQTDNRPPSSLHNKVITNTDLFCIQCSEGLYGKLLLIDKSIIPSNVNKWTWYDFILDSSDPNRIVSISNVNNNAWR